MGVPGSSIDAQFTALAVSVHTCLSGLPSTRPYLDLVCNGTKGEKVSLLSAKHLAR